MVALDNVLSSDQIQKINAFADSNYPYEKFMFVFPNLNPEFKKFFLANISDEIRRYVNEDSYIVLRMVNAESHGQEHQFHFDTYEETILIPLVGSDAAENGDLLINSNTRKSPRGPISHVIGKLLFQNPIAAYFLKRNMTKRFKRISVKPGGLFQFNGAVCLHGNMPLKSGQRRTVLIHNKKLFKHSKLTHAVESFSQYRVAK